MDAVFTERKGDVSIVHLNGRFDASSSAHIHDKIMTEIENEDCTNLILNFEKVELYIQCRSKNSNICI